MSQEERIPISVIVMTKNEERNIRKCLGALSFFDEVFVVDSLSDDRTREIAEGLGARVVEFRWNGKYPKKKQWCLENLPFKNDWVLYVDADEEVLQELMKEIRSLMKKGPAHAGYFVRYNYVFLGKILKYGQRICKLVLLNRHLSRFIDYDDLDAVNMWEVEGHYQPNIKGTTGILRNYMLHNDHESLFHYFERHNRYSDWEAVLRTKQKIVSPDEAQRVGRHTLKKVFNAIPFKGLAMFIYSYFCRFGFLDGKAGFNYALAKGFYYWQISLKGGELRRRSQN